MLVFAYISRNQGCSQACASCCTTLHQEGCSQACVNSSTNLHWGPVYGDVRIHLEGIVSMSARIHVAPGRVQPGMLHRLHQPARNLALSWIQQFLGTSSNSAPVEAATRLRQEAQKLWLNA